MTLLVVFHFSCSIDQFTGPHFILAQSGQEPIGWRWKYSSIWRLRLFWPGVLWHSTESTHTHTHTHKRKLTEAQPNFRWITPLGRAAKFWLSLLLWKAANLLLGVGPLGACRTTAVFQRQGKQSAELGSPKQGVDATWFLSLLRVPVAAYTWLTLFHASFGKHDAII